MRRKADAAPGRIFDATSVRLSLQFAALYALLTVLVFAGALWLADYELGEWLEDQLMLTGQALEKEYNRGGTELVRQAISVLSEISIESDRIYFLTGSDGQVLAGNVRAIARLQGQNTVPADQIRFHKAPDVESFSYRIEELQIGPNRLIMGISRNLTTEVLEALAEAMIVGFLAVVMLGTGAGVLVGRRTERQINAISTSLAAVSDGDLGRRIRLTTTSSGDLARVSRSVNDALDRIQGLVESQSQISADIAHDLRTPLQRLRQCLEAMQNTPQSGVISHGDVEKALEQTDEIIGTFHALLRIAQIEAGKRRERFSRFDLNEIFHNVADAYDAVAEDAGHSFKASAPADPVIIRGDRELLSQMMSNLLENSIRHCTVPAKILFRLESEPLETTILVADTGPGISTAERERVFRRFYRLEKSRTSPGNGLGLSLVKAIVDLHGATIALSDNDPGLCVTISFVASTNFGGQPPK